MRVRPIGTSGVDGFKNGEQMAGLMQRRRLGHGEGFGMLTFGTAVMGGDRFISGIYQRRTFNAQNALHNPSLLGKHYYVAMRDYAPPYSRTPAQDTYRTKMADAMLAYQNLTTEEKAEYTARAHRQGRRPHNLFVSEFIKNN